MANAPSSFLGRLNRGLSLVCVAGALIAVGAQAWIWMLGFGIAAAIFAGLARLERATAQGTSTTASIDTPISAPLASSATAAPAAADEMAADEGEGEEDETEVEIEDEDDGAEPTELLHDALRSMKGEAELLAEVERLLALGADAAEENGDGDNALVIGALEMAPVSVLQRLADAGASVEHRVGLLADILTDEYDNADLVKLLLAHGASANDESHDYHSLVEQALETGCDDEVILALLASGPTPETDSNDHDWLFLATEQGRSPRVIAAILEAARRAGVPMDLATSLTKSLEDDTALTATLLVAGANPFEPDVEETVPVTMALDNDDIGALRLFAQSLPQRDRYRLLGRAEASETFGELEALEGWVDAFDALEARWAQGYGDPSSPAMYAEEPQAAGLNTSLRENTQGLRAQRLLLAGADPFWAPAGHPSAFEQACRRRDGMFVAMALETQSADEAEFRLNTLPQPDADWVEMARAELGLRRQARGRVVAPPQDQAGAITEQLNDVYTHGSDAIDPALADAQSRTLPSETW